MTSPTQYQSDVSDETEDEDPDQLATIEPTTHTYSTPVPPGIDARNPTQKLAHVQVAINELRSVAKNSLSQFPADDGRMDQILLPKHITSLATAPRLSAAQREELTRLYVQQIAFTRLQDPHHKAKLALCYLDLSLHYLKDRLLYHQSFAHAKTAQRLLREVKSAPSAAPRENPTESFDWSLHRSSQAIITLYYVMGFSLVNLSQFGEGTKALKRSEKELTVLGPSLSQEELNEQQYHIHFALAKSEEMQQNYNECLRELLKCLEYAEVFSFPALIEAHVNTARIHRQSGRAESAALAYHSACDLADRRVKDGRQHALVALELARFHVQAENDSKAEPLLCRALQIFLDLLGGDCVACVSLQVLARLGELDLDEPASLISSSCWWLNTSKGRPDEGIAPLASARRRGRVAQANLENKVVCFWEVFTGSR
eukprot:m.156280 g.156280  ORF g.156280 m.156280 type:complete len:429 (+) comp52929_c0_seq14:826-2112(+)